MKPVGQYVFGAAAILIGVVGLWSGALTGVWQPTPDWAEQLVAFPYVIAALFLIGGIAVLFSRPEQVGAALLALLYAFFALLWVKRIIMFPALVATWSGCAEELILVIAASTILFRGQLARPGAARNALRVSFGLCAILFGLNHFQNLPATIAMVPAFIPPGQRFWAIATGVADICAGVAVLASVRAVLAVRLLTVMFASYSLFIWLPSLVQNPHEHGAWAGNAVNLALIGAVWLFADYLEAARQREHRADR